MGRCKLTHCPCLPPQPDVLCPFPLTLEVLPHSPSSEASTLCRTYNPCPSLLVWPWTGTHWTRVFCFSNELSPGTDLLFFFPLVFGMKQLLRMLCPGGSHRKATPKEEWVEPSQQLWVEGGWHGLDSHSGATRPPSLWNLMPQMGATQLSTGGFCSIAS